MTARSVLFIGFDPQRMDLTGAPEGAAAGIQAGIDRSMRELGEDGFDASFHPLAEGDPDAATTVREALRARSYDCVVIGAGVRLLPKHTALFEALVNVVFELAPTCRLAFNASPGDAAEAVRRRLGAAADRA